MVTGWDFGYCFDQWHIACLNIYAIKRIIATSDRLPF